jgi:hypothetical protein
MNKTTKMSCLGRTVSPYYCVLALLCVLFLDVASAQDCLATTNALTVQEALVNDVTQQRTYSLCPNTTYNIGYFDYSYNVVDGQDMLQLRPNMHVKCGSHGLKENNCILQGGSVQVDGTSRYGVAQVTLQNVVLEGLTFVNASEHLVLLNKPGQVTFRNCEFRVS